MSDDEVPRLSAESLKALQEFLQEQAQQKESKIIDENWQLSQFWYDENTTLALSKAALAMCHDEGKIALVSCPTLYERIKSLIEMDKSEKRVVLFEYDKRFAKYDSDFVFYDYNSPLELNSELKNSFDVIVLDPPFLSEECLSKFAKTVSLVGKFNCKIILCTGSTMEDLAFKLLNVKKCSFQPKHRNNLANEFVCLTNFGELPI